MWRRRSALNHSSPVVSLTRWELAMTSCPSRVRAMTVLGVQKAKSSSSRMASQCASERKSSRITILSNLSRFEVDVTAARRG
jgi:hypothetical protein